MVMSSNSPNVEDAARSAAKTINLSVYCDQNQTLMALPPEPLCRDVVAATTLRLQRRP